MFNPQAFSDGQIIWDLTTSVDTEHDYLHTFELHRRTFVVIAVADYEESVASPSPDYSAMLASQLADLKSLVSPPPAADTPQAYESFLFPSALPPTRPAPRPQMGWLVGRMDGWTVPYSILKPSITSA